MAKKPKAFEKRVSEFKKIAGELSTTVEDHLTTGQDLFIEAMMRGVPAEELVDLAIHWRGSKSVKKVTSVSQMETLFEKYGDLSKKIEVFDD